MSKTSEQIIVDFLKELLRVNPELEPIKDLFQQAVEKSLNEGYFGDVKQLKEDVKQLIIKQYSNPKFNKVNPKEFL